MPEAKEPVSYTIRQMPAGLRPRERLLREGPRALSEAELLAIVLRVGSGGKTALQLAEEILVSTDGLHRLSDAGTEELSSHKGVGEAKVAQIKAALELGRRLYRAERKQLVVIDTPEDAARLLMADLRYLDREHLWVLCLNVRNGLIASELVSIGTVSGSLAHPRECFRPALRNGAASVVYVHNHPSGDPSPSADDIELTRQLQQAGELLGIDLLDHVIIGDGVFVSLKELGVI